MTTVRRPGEVELVEIAARSVLNRVTGMGFGWSINPYQGCFHQCVFCYARRTHAYRDLDGERSWGARIFVKVNAARVLRTELAKPSWQRDVVAIGTATDPYQPAEGRYRITRGVLAELLRVANPTHLITRSPLIVRDLDILTDLARVADVGIAISLVTLNETLARELEPTVAPPAQRLRAVRALAEAGIRVGVALAPVLPGITDDRAALREVLRAAADAGAAHAWVGSLNLGEVTREAFFAWLADARPELVPRYRGLYHGKYLSGDAKRAFDALGRDVRREVRFRPPRHLVAVPPPEPQLRLLDSVKES